MALFFACVIGLLVVAIIGLGVYTIIHVLLNGADSL
jgi:hypothetical protein